MTRTLASLLLLVVGCGEPTLRPGSGPGDAGPGDDAAALDAGRAPVDASTSPVDAGPDVGIDATVPPPPAMPCGYRADDYDAVQQELDTDPTGPRLRFFVRGVPDPSLLESATLRFATFDADHPGEEGTIWVNGAGPFDLPASAGADNADGTGSLDVLAAMAAGDNLIEFGPGPLPRSFFRIGQVVVDTLARVAECSPPPPPPDPRAVERSLHYRDATYTNRGTWVVRCADYAFTASGDEHVASDCDGLYRAGGDRRGTATFHFPAVVRADYEVVIRSRHTANRNPSGALFIVDGVERRISQRSDRNITDDVWGTARLEGDVDVVLDSSRESQSDSVVSIRLVPVTP